MMGIKRHLCNLQANLLLGQVYTPKRRSLLSPHQPEAPRRHAGCVDAPGANPSSSLNQSSLSKAMFQLQHTSYSK